MRFLRTIMTEYCMAAAQLMLPANRAFNSNGLAVPGAKAYLYTTETTTPQPFYANAGLTASLGSVLTANGAGRFQPAYQDTSIPFRLRLEDADGAELDDIDPFYFGQTAITVNSNFVTPQMYGAVADGVTDDSAAFLAAIAALNETTAYGYSTQTCGTLHIPVGEYYLGTTTLDLTATIIIEGENTGGAGGGASVLRWAAGTTGIRVQRATTTGATGTQASSGHGGDGSIIRNLYLKGGFTSTEAEAHGIHLRATATIRDCFIEYFQGDGIYIKATIGGGVGSEGAANLFHIDKVLVQYCRNGLYVEGADANAGVVSGFCAVACRQWGIWDKSFLGNTYNAPHVAACGRVSWNVASNSPAQPASFASNAGNRFVVIRGQETGAVTNSPPATATNNTYWIYVGAGAADAATGVVAWSSGLLWRAGGGYLIEGLNNATTLLNPYGEIDQYSQFDQNVSIVGNGFLQGHTKVSAGVAATYRLGSFGASLIGTRFYGGVEALGPLNAKDATNQLGPGEGTAAEGSTELRTRNTYHELIAKVYNSSGTATGTIGTITFRDGLGLDYDTTGGAWWHRFKVAASTIGTITASGLDLASGKDLMFNGTTVPIGNTTASKLIGRGSAGAGVAQEITLGTGLSMSGTTLSTAFRGALVKKSADQTTANYSTETAVAWDAEEYDTDTIHDTVTNNSRLTVPSGFTKVRVGFDLGLSAVTSGTGVYATVYKNGLVFIGAPDFAASAITTTDWRSGGLWSPVLSVSSGDYFEVKIQTGDTSITVAKDFSWFAMEIIA